jgi:hypothetical protein
VEERDNQPGKDIWLYIRQLEDGSTKYSICNISADAPISSIRSLAMMRWSIEQCFKECKNYLGMDHYEVRTLTGWRRHILLTFLAHLFVCKLRRRFSTKPNPQGQDPLGVHPPSSNFHKFDLSGSKLAGLSGFNGPAPIVDNPMPFNEYMEAIGNIVNNKPINNSKIHLNPTNPQQILTIGLIIKIIGHFTVKLGDVFKNINYQLESNYDSYCSSSWKKVEKTFEASEKKLKP